MVKNRFLIGTVAWFTLSLTCIAQCSGHAQLNQYERGQFIQVAQGLRAEVSAQFLAEPGCGRPMLEALRQLGAKIDFADEKSGFALVIVPRERLLDTLDIAGIEYAYTRDDDRNYYKDPAAKVPQRERKAEPVPAIAIPYPRVATTLAPDGPYFDAAAIGLPELWKQHPEADGRGVVVAVPDEGMDLLHPELQQGRDRNGKIVPKIADLSMLTSQDEDAGWVQFGEPIQNASRTFGAAGRTWSVPRKGTYRFAIFQRDLVLGPEDNSHAKKLSLSVGVLWDEASAKVWVDTNGDGSFANERALGDYGETHDIAWFGTKEGEDDNRIPFGVKIDAAHKAAYIDIGGEHGVLVGGPLAGNKLTGGLFDGAAPSAQLIDSRSGRVGYLADLVAMFARPDVDVINRSGGLGRAGYTGDRAGIEDFAQRVVEREIAIYQKPIATYTAATGGIHVNDYAGPTMLRRNRQVGPPYKETINSFVWDGLLNVVLAPSANLETDSRYKPQDLIYPDGIRYMWEEGKKNPPAPAGYVIGANNSPTIPVVSGILADLISEARKEKVRYDAIRLNNALFTGAHLLKGIPVSRQGYGLVNAADSWNQLAKMSRADDPANSELTSFSVSMPDDSGAGKNPGKTTDLVQKETIEEFHRDLMRAGEQVEGEISITRHGGYAEGRRYQLSLRGDAKSFILLDHHVTLVRDKPARVRFRSSGAPGWNIALLELRDVKADVVMEDVPLSVRTPEEPEKIALGVEKYEATIPPLTSQNAYVQVGEEVQATRYVMKIPYTGPANISTRGFPGGSYRHTTTPPGEAVDVEHHVGPMETLQSLVLNDTPGMASIFWENHGRPEYATKYDGPAPDVPIHAELTVTKYAASMVKGPSNMLKVINKLAEVEGHVELYDAKIVSSEVKSDGNHAMGRTKFEVPANLVQWRVKVAGAIAGTHTDAYLFTCTDKKGCSVVSQQEITNKSALFVVDKPAAGTWKIVIRSREEVTGTSTFKITEAQLTPTQMEAAEMNTKHASGEEWTVALQNSTRYAAFRIAGTPGVDREKEGLLIAMTPLDANVP